MPERCVRELAVLDLLATLPAQARLDAARVEHYLHAPGPLAPIVVLDTPEGRLVADGHHRLEAARRQGRTTITAEVRRGTRADALRYATDRAARERGISRAEARRQILGGGRRLPTSG